MQRHKGWLQKSATLCPISLHLTPHLWICTTTNPRFTSCCSLRVGHMILYMFCLQKRSMTGWLITREQSLISQHTRPRQHWSLTRHKHKQFQHRKWISIHRKHPIIWHYGHLLVQGWIAVWDNHWWKTSVISLNWLIKCPKWQIGLTSAV